MSISRFLKTRLVLTLTLMLMALTACQPREKPVKMRLLAFGTWVDITLYGVKGKKAEALEATLSTEIERMHRDWNAWHPSELTRLNAAFAAGRTAPINGQMQTLLMMAKAMTKASDGLFDPAIGHLLKLWGFQRDDPFNVHSLPDQAALQAYMKHRPSMNDVVLGDASVSSKNPLVALDFGGFGKGFAIDLLIEELRRQGVSNAMINAGGDLRVIGTAGGHNWRIGIRNPRGKGVIGIIQAAADSSIFTSGDYERGYTINGQHYQHIINPLTGRPATGISSATVIGANGAWSDAASTTMLLAGPQRAPALAAKMGVKHLLLITDDGQAYADAGMLKRIEWVDRPAQIHLLKLNTLVTTTRVPHTANHRQQERQND